MKIDNDLINNKEFTKCIEDAAPHRAKIIQEIGPDMRRVQQDFITLMTNANWKNAKFIQSNLKNNKKDPDAIADYKNWRKGVMKIFRSVLKTIHPNENQIPGIGMLYIAGTFLNYIGRSELIMNNPNIDKENPLQFKKLESINSYFKNEEVKRKMEEIFTTADAIQGEMCENADMIKKHYYELLPDEIKFDKEGNKKGIKQNHFGQLVRHEAFKSIKDVQKYNNYIKAQIDNSDNNVYRETIVFEKTKTLK